jgi:short-subunit dehydrogenase
MDFSSQTLVLTGATGGIGQAIAQALAAKGARLLLVARHEDDLRLLAEQLAASNGTEDKYHWVRADLTTTMGRYAIIEAAKKMNANGLINNAGISQFDALKNITEEDFHQAMEINLLAPICLSRAFLYQFNQQQNKTVVNVGSALGSIGFPYYTSYCASKFGLRGFTEALKRELADTQHTVLYFAPRATQTTMNSDAVNQMNAMLGNSIDSPQKVAEALIAQLSSGASRTIVGWPEKLLALLNGLLPGVVDKALAKKLKSISHLIHGSK